MKYLIVGLLVALCAQEAFAIRRHQVRGHQYRPRKEENGETYVVLVAGSNGWYNYRHQADIAHAYHTLLDHGIRPRNIITMMYDDVADSTMNPYPGKLFNRPHGKDLYNGLNIDYKGESVTPQNFINILKGNSSGVVGGNGRVLKTTSEDRIFIYFTDHGAVGLIAFPDEMLTAKDLNDALVYLHKNKKYSQLVFYLEACESGSMFDSILKDDLDIYAITAANSHESSWGTYCENDMNLPCLGDLFSVNWMTDSDEEDLTRETLESQYELVKKETNLSHVMQFGDKSIASEAVGLFQGEKKVVDVRYLKNLESDEELTDEMIEAAVRAKLSNQKPADSVNWPARDIELNHLKYLFRSSNDVYEKQTLTRQINEIRETRRKVKAVFHKVVDSLLESDSEKRRMFENKRPVLDLKCHHSIVHAFDKYCVDFQKYDYALKYVNVLNNLCIELGFEAIATRLPEICIDVDLEDDSSEETDD